MFDKHRNPDGTYNGVTAMAEVTGLPQGEILSLFEQVKANHAKLDGCPWHVFDAIPVDYSRADAPKKADRYRCRHCQGEVDFSAYHWHEKGRRPRRFDSPAEFAEHYLGKPYQFEPVPGATCSQELAAAGKPYPRTCQVHGLTCGVKPAPDAQSDAPA